MLCEAHCREPRIKYTTKPKPEDDSHSFIHTYIHVLLSLNDATR